MPLEELKWHVSCPSCDRPIPRPGDEAGNVKRLMRLSCTMDLRVTYLYTFTARTDYRGFSILRYGPYAQ